MIATWTETSPRNQQLTLAYFGSFMAMGFMTASLGPTLPGLARHTGSGLEEIGLLITARAAGALLANLFIGWLYDRTYGHPIMVLALTVMALTMFIVPLLGNIWLLTLVFLVMGITESSINVGGNTLLIWVHGSGVGTFMNGLHFSYSIGAFITPLIVAVTLTLTNDIVLAYWALAVLIVLAIPWLRRHPSPMHEREKQTVSRAGSNYLFIIIVTLFFFVLAGSTVGFIGWLATYVVETRIGSETVGAYITSAYLGAVLLGRFVGIPIATRYSPKTILAIDVLGRALSMVLIVVVHNTAGLWLGTIFLGLSNASIFPAVFAFAGRRMAITGTITSTFLIGVSLGSMVVPPILGALFEWHGIDMMMPIILVGVSLNALIYVFLGMFPLQTADETSVSA